MARVGVRIVEPLRLVIAYFIHCQIKVTICAGFSGTVRIFNDVSRKKSQFSRDAHLSCFWHGVLDLSQH